MEIPFTHILLRIENVESWRYEQEYQWPIPDAFVPAVNRLQFTYNTNMTQALGCVSYRPDNINASDVPTYLTALMYVVRLATCMVTTVGKQRTRGPRTLCDVYIYSNPLLHVYKLVATRKIENSDLTVRLVNLNATDLALLNAFACSTGLQLYRYLQFQTHYMRVSDVWKSNSSDYLSDPLYVTRDEWDLTSVSQEWIGKCIGEMVSPDTNGRSDPNFPNVCPVFYVTCRNEIMVTIVRCIEICTALLYDVHYRACTWACTMTAFALVHVSSVISAFKKHRRERTAGESPW